jgi:hypothetical protein
MLPKLMTLSLFLAESAKLVPCGRMYPRLLTTAPPPSESLESRDLLEVVEKVEQVGVDTVRSSLGIASRAREGETLGQGDSGRMSGELSVLVGGVVVSSLEAMLAPSCRDGMGCVTGGGGVWVFRRSSSAT